MANPQAEDGYTRLANEIVQALMRTNLSAYQSRILWAIWRRTYGWHKKEDHIPGSQLVKMTGISKGHVCRALKELKLRRIVTQSGNGLAFNKDYQRWQKLPNGVTPYRVTQPGLKVTQPGNKKLPNRADSKESKETIKRKPPIVPHKVCMEILEGYPRIRAENETIRNINYWLKKNIEPSDLIRAKNNYKAHVEKEQTPPNMVFVSYNFFGQRKAYWKDWLKEPVLSEVDKALAEMYAKDAEREKKRLEGRTQ